MSGYDCVYLDYTPATIYQPSESYCDYGEENGYNCDNCPHRLTQEDLYGIREDMEYDRYIDEVEFGI